MNRAVRAAAEAWALASAFAAMAVALLYITFGEFGVGRVIGTAAALGSLAGVTVFLAVLASVTSRFPPSRMGREVFFTASSGNWSTHACWAAAQWPLEALFSGAHLSEGISGCVVTCPHECRRFVSQVFALQQTSPVRLPRRSRGDRTGLPRLRSRGPVSQGTVWPDRVVVLPPPLDEHLGLEQRVERFACQQLVPKLPVEAFHIAVLPR